MCHEELASKMRKSFRSEERIRAAVVVTVKERGWRLWGRVTVQEGLHAEGGSADGATRWQSAPRGSPSLDLRAVVVPLCGVEPRLEKSADQNLREISQKRKKKNLGRTQTHQRERGGGKQERKLAGRTKPENRRTKEDDVNRGEKAQGERRANSVDLRPTSVFHQSCFLFR